MNAPPPGSALDGMLERARAGDRPALARLLSLLERGGGAAATVDRLAFGLAGRAYLVGVTGAPGAGKSTLTNRMIRAERDAGSRVGVLAIDPTSPFSGGAILGDRVRMADHVLDSGVFVRSFASRGELGGLARAVPPAARLLDAAGYSLVILETVGVGQVEVEVASQTDTTVVVLTPGWGDAVQAAKAGLLEVADVFCVNKADRPGASEVVRDLAAMLDLAPKDRWRPPIVTTAATEGAGTEKLMEAIGAHREHLAGSGELAERRAGRLRAEVEHLVATELAARAAGSLAGPDAGEVLAAVAAHDLDPASAALRLLDGAAGTRAGDPGRVQDGGR